MARPVLRRAMLRRVLHHATLFLALTAFCQGLLATALANGVTAGAGHQYLTWKGGEADKGAAAWFIKRYVDQEATFRAVEIDTPVSGPNLFDVPQAEHRRTHNSSTTASLLRAHPVSDVAANRLGQVMNDIEINLWRPKAYRESQVIEGRVKEIGMGYPDGSIPFDCFIAFYDNVHRWMQGELSAALLETPSVCVTGAR